MDTRTERQTYRESETERQSGTQTLRPVLWTSKQQLKLRGRCDYKLQTQHINITHSLTTNNELRTQSQQTCHNFFNSNASLSETLSESYQSNNKNRVPRLYYLLSVISHTMNCPSPFNSAVCTNLYNAPDAVRPIYFLSDREDIRICKH